MKSKKSLIKAGLIFALLALLIVAFGIYQTLSHSAVIESWPIAVPQTGAISISDDGSLVGTISKKNTTKIGEIFVDIRNKKGGTVFSSSLEKFNPYSEVTSNKISYSPDGHYAAFAINDSGDYRLSRIMLIDLRQGTIADLSDENYFGERAMSFGALPPSNPIWTSDNTIIFERVKRGEGEYLVELRVEKNVNEGRILMADIPFAYSPAVSLDRSEIAFAKTQGAGKTNLQILDIKTDKTSPTDVNFDSIREISWSPDNRFITFIYTADFRNSNGLLNLAAVDIATGAIIPIGIGEYLTNPQWLDAKRIALSYWTPTPFRGNNIHEFSKIKIFNTLNGSFTNVCLNLRGNRYTVLPQSQKIIFAHKAGGLYSFNASQAFTPNWLDKIRNIAGLGVNGLISYGSKCQGEEIPQPVANKTSTNASVSQKNYANDNFGVSFSYPSDWELLEASGAGYMNLTLGKDTDGIEIQMMGISGDKFNESTFRTTLEQTVKNGATFDKFEKISIGGKNFYRVLIKQGWQELSYSYYGHEPVNSKAMPKLGSFIPIFTFVSYGKEDPNPTQAVLEKMLGTLSVETPTILPKGYTLDSYKIEEVLNSACQLDSDCSTPAKYLIQSRCPFVSKCLDGKCAIVCPDYKSQ